MHSNLLTRHTERNTTPPSSSMAIEPAEPADTAPLLGGAGQVGRQRLFFYGEDCLPLRLPQILRLSAPALQSPGRPGSPLVAAAAAAATAPPPPSSKAAHLDLRFRERFLAIMRLLRPYPALALAALSILESITVAEGDPAPHLLPCQC